MSKSGAKLLLVMVFIARGTSFLFSKTLLQETVLLLILETVFKLHSSSVVVAVDGLTL